MKIFFRSFSIFALCVALTFVFANHASASETEEVDYASLFAQAQSVTPETTEEYVYDLNKAFTTNQTAFLDALSCNDKGLVSHVIYYLVSGKTLDEIYDLRDFVFTNIGGSEYNDIISALNEQISVREYALTTEHYLQYENPDAPFSVANIKRLIDLNIANETYDTDEEFNHIIAMAYEASPLIFADMISTYTHAEIGSLARCISADYAKFDKPAPSITCEPSSIDNMDIINLIQEEIKGTVNHQISTDVITLAPSADLMATYVPTIGAMIYKTDPLIVGESATLSITFTENSNIAAVRQWYVEIYQVIGSTYTLKKAQTIGISPGATSATLNFNLSFANPSTFYTHVKVYSAQGGTLLASRTGAYPDTVYYRWRISIALNSNRNLLGTLYLYDASGNLVFQASCLGRSASNASELDFEGNTPTGLYRVVQGCQPHDQRKNE